MQGPSQKSNAGADQTSTSNPTGAEPDWSRPIWVAIYRPVSGTFRKTQMIEGSIVLWDTRPFTSEQMQELYQPGDPVIFWERPNNQHTGGIIAVASTGEITLSSASSPKIQLKIINSLSDDPIADDEIPPPMTPFGNRFSADGDLLGRLDEKDSKTIRAMIRQKAGLTVVGKIPEMQTKAAQSQSAAPDPPIPSGSSTSPAPDPNQPRPIWIALYTPDIAKKIEPDLFESRYKWSTRPTSINDINKTLSPNDPVVVIRAAGTSQPGGIVAIAQSGSVAINRSQGPRVAINQVQDVRENNISTDELTQLKLSLPDTLDETALFQLDQEQSETLRSFLTDQHSLTLSGQPLQGDSGFSVEQIEQAILENEAFERVEERASQSKAPESHPPHNTKTRFSQDRPTSVIDKLKRAPNAFVIAQYLNRLRGTPDSHQDHDSYILHVDAPWGGGKTTFANFIANFLSFARHKTPADEMEFISTSGVGPERLEKMADNNWMILRFNAWENQHVSPPWWNFYTSFLNGYKDHVAHPTGLQINEWAWRIFTPETWKSIGVTTLLVVTAYILAGISGITAAENPIASLLGATTLAAFIFTQAKAGMKRIVDATNSAHNPTVLGEEDPLSRLRSRFREVAGYENRPVLMIIDDIDRCEPEYVVELMRGLITLFQSNHVSYLILGDRGWIEQSFEHVNDNMSAAHTDPTVSFGARFAEKAIQMSYLLPEVARDERQSYLRSLLPNSEPATPTAQIDLQTQFKDAKDIAAVEAQQEIAEAETAKIADPILRKERSEAIQIQATIARAQAEDRDDEIEHGLIEIWHLLPENPRRVKRLVNMIAVYQASAQTSLNIDPKNRKQWLPMVLWLILFSEFPKVFEAIHADPDVLEALPAPNADKLKLNWKLPHGLPNDARDVINGIGEDADAIRLTPDIARTLRQLTPLV